MYTIHVHAIMQYWHGVYMYNADKQKLHVSIYSILLTYYSGTAEYCRSPWKTETLEVFFSWGPSTSVGVTHSLLYGITCMYKVSWYNCVNSFLLLYLHVHVYQILIVYTYLIVTLAPGSTPPSNIKKWFYLRNQLKHRHWHHVT